MDFEDNDILLKVMRSHCLHYSGSSCGMLLSIAPTGYTCFCNNALNIYVDASNRAHTKWFGKGVTNE